MTFMMWLLVVVLVVVAAGAAYVLWRASLGKRARAYDPNLNPARPPGQGF